MKKIEIVEVSLRDGLQNEARTLSIEKRVQIAKLVLGAGLERIELGAFVRYDKVPQMIGTAKILSELRRAKNLRGSVLVPNRRGMEDAIAAGAKEVAVFAACSETFSQKNINCSIEESFHRFSEVFALARKNKIKVRGYLSTCFGCPYEGNVPPRQVIRLTEQLFKLGCFEVSIGDTIGVAVPTQVQKLMGSLVEKFSSKRIAGHYHDTRGTAVANVYASLGVGVRIFDSSLGGLGGCPYALGASGNVATEDLVYMLSGTHHKTDINLRKLLKAQEFLRKALHLHELRSKVGKAGLPFWHQN
jgi:hydroxymethylglutaryl-CoA lyase